MSSSEGRLTDSHGIIQPAQHSTTANGEKSLDSKQIFNLIETLLPLEVCLHYQVLPLELHQSRLLLGMVDPEDDPALEYVSRMVSYLGRIIDTQAIAATSHQQLLSAYLHYKNSNADISADQQSEKLERQEECIILGFEPIQTSGGSELNAVDIVAIDLRLDESQAITKEAFPTARINVSSNQAYRETTKFQSNNTVLQSAKTRNKLSKDLPLLSLPQPEELNPIEILPNLTPKQLLTELLARVVAKGIGRLYLERQPYTGKVSWINNGVLQSALEQLPLPTYQGLLNELKRFASIGVATVKSPKQVEQEYYYQNHRLLIRLRIMPGEHGENATLQVLKGAALQYYHQRQIERLSNDSLKITQKLTDKIHQLRNRLLMNTSNSQSEKLTAVDNLNQLLDKLDYQIKILSIPTEG